MAFTLQSAAYGAEILKALSHPVRLRIIATLAHQPTHVTDLVSDLGISQPVISQQLRILRMNKLVSKSREAGFSVYRLSEPNLKDLIETMERCCARRERELEVHQ
jgi:DNA-binding transcriptional ArsR family regulator